MRTTKLRHRRGQLHNRRFGYADSVLSAEEILHGAEHPNFDERPLERSRREFFVAVDKKHAVDFQLGRQRRNTYKTAAK